MAISVWLLGIRMNFFNEICFVKVESVKKVCSSIHIELGLHIMGPNYL